MNKNFLDELMEALRGEEKEVTISAPIAPHKVICVFTQVVQTHELTWDEKRNLAVTAMSFDGITSDEAEIINELDSSRELNAVDERKTFAEELNENLRALKDDQKKHTVTAPVAPHVVLRTIAKVAKNHKMTNEERAALLSAVAALRTDISVEEIQALQNADNE